MKKIKMKKTRSSVLLPRLDPSPSMSRQNMDDKNLRHPRSSCRCCCSLHCLSVLHLGKYMKTVVLWQVRLVHASDPVSEDVLVQRRLALMRTESLWIEWLSNWTRSQEEQKDRSLSFQLSIRSAMLQIVSNGSNKHLFEQRDWKSPQLYGHGFEDGLLSHPP